MKKAFSLFLLSSLLLSLPAVAADHHKNLQFSFDKPSIVVNNSVIRSDRDIYHINAQKGSYLSISISSTEHNACLQVTPMVSNTPIPCTVEEQHSGFVWGCVLPVSGAYNIMVSPSRGNCSYKMEINVID